MDANSCNKKMPRNQSWQDFEKVAYQSHQKSINNVKLINERIEKLRKEIRSTKK